MFVCLHECVCTDKQRFYSMSRGRAMYSALYGHSSETTHQKEVTSIDRAANLTIYNVSNVLSLYRDCKCFALAFSSWRMQWTVNKKKRTASLVDWN